MGKYNPGDNVYKAVEELQKVEHAFMDVETFRRKYLPRFWENDPEVYAEWLRHIGKPFRRCDLVQRGQKVGEVPPLAKQTPTRETNDARLSLYERLSTLQNHIKRLPQAEKRLTEQALKDLFPHATPDPGLILEWDELFKAFGYPGFLTEAPETEDDDTPTDTPVKFDGYEEL